MKYSPPFALFYFVEGLFFGVGLTLQFNNPHELWVVLSLAALPAMAITVLAETSFFHDHK